MRIHILQAYNYHLQLSYLSFAHVHTQLLKSLFQSQCVVCAMCMHSWNVTLGAIVSSVELAFTRIFKYCSILKFCALFNRQGLKLSEYSHPNELIEHVNQSVNPCFIQLHSLRLKSEL